MEAEMSYDAFATMRGRLASSLEVVERVFRRLEATKRAEQLSRQRGVLLADMFKILVVGEFKRGKSTLINAMLGEQVLPARTAPCTAVITRLTYGETRSAVLHRKDGQPPLRLDLEANPNALREHITIRNLGREDNSGQAAAVRSSPYEAAEVFYPLLLCRNGVEIVDSPGLNEHHARTSVTKAFLDEADAMVVVLSCRQQLSETEVRFIDVDLKGVDLRDTFFVWNCYDKEIRESTTDREDLAEISRNRLESRIGRRSRVFFVSAREALSARLQEDALAAEESGLPEFETALERFLTAERGRVKLSKPLRVAENAVQEGLLDLLLQRERLYQLPLQELRDRLDLCRPKLEEAERQRVRILALVERRGAAMVREVGVAVRELASKLEASIARQVQLFPLSTWDTIRSRSEVKEQLSRSLEERLRAECDRWQQMTLLPLLRTHLTELELDLQDQSRSLCENLDAIRAAFQPPVDGREIARAENLTGLERLMGAGLGVIGGIGSMVEGASMGVGHAARGLTVHLTAGIAMSLLGFGLPVILPALAAIGLWRTLVGAKRAADELRAAVVKEFCEALRTKAPDVERGLISKIEAMIQGLRTDLDERMGVKVEEVNGQVEAVIREREQHEGRLKSVLSELADLRGELQMQAQALAELRDDVDPSGRNRNQSPEAGGGVATDHSGVGAETKSRPAEEAPGTISLGALRIHPDRVTVDGDPTVRVLLGRGVTHRLFLRLAEAKGKPVHADHLRDVWRDETGNEPLMAGNPVSNAVSKLKAWLRDERLDRFVTVESGGKTSPHYSLKSV